MVLITIKETLSFDTTLVSSDVLKSIKKDFRVANPNYDERIKDSDEPKYLNCYDIKGNMMHVPRGWSSYLTYWFQENNIEYKLVDKRVLLDDIYIPPVKFKLFKHQSRWVKKAFPLSQGTVESPCGSGKTIGGISLMQKCSQPSLIIVPDNELLKQWCQNIVDVTGIDYDRLGVLTSEKVIVEVEGKSYRVYNGVNDITIATNMSLYDRVKDYDFCCSFGFVLLDECHMVGARTFREVMNSFPARYRYGLTATPFRNDNLTELIAAYCGTQFYTVTDDDLLKAGLLVTPTLHVIETNFYYDYNYRYMADYNRMLSEMQKDEARNNLIVDKLVEELNEKRMCLVIAKQVNHCRILEKLIKDRLPKVRIGFMAGDKYDEKTSELAREGKIDLIFAINRAKQGLDIKPLESVFIVAPRKAKGEVQQIVGRIQRPDLCFGKYKNKNEKDTRVYDFIDNRVSVLINSFNERYKIYKDKCIVIDDIEQLTTLRKNKGGVVRNVKKANRRRYSKRNAR